MDCQGEVGVSSSMAAVVLAAVLGGSNEELDKAVEIGTGHNLGLTCDTVGGLLQSPCNAIGATKQSPRHRLSGDCHHYVTRDNDIKTVRQTGADMQTKYKETSLGGLTRLERSLVLIGQSDG